MSVDIVFASQPALFRRMRSVPLLPYLGLLPLLVKVLALRAAGKQPARTWFGAELLCDPTDMIQLYTLLFGVWEPDVSLTVERLLQPGDTFIDIGANVGYDSLLGSTRVGSTGRVVAIEASPSTFALLEANLARNPGAGNVRAVNVAAAREAGTLELYDVTAGNIGAATTIATRGGKRIATVPALPLADILTAEELAATRLIKIDVEGAEPAILATILDHLPRFSPQLEIIVEMSADAADSPEIFDRLVEAGFTAQAIENRYDIFWYMTWQHPTPLCRVTTLPAEQTDLLFSRAASA